MGLDAHDPAAIALLKEITESYKRVNLGPPPWSHEVLTKAYHRSFSATRIAIQKHPGYTNHRDLEGMAASMKEVRGTGEELFAAFQCFWSAAEQDSFWWPARQSQFDDALDLVQRRLFAAATAATAFIHHCAVSAKHIIEPNLTCPRNIIDGIQETKEHCIVDALRNISSHVRTVPVNWEARLTNPGQEILFFLPSDELLRKDNWSRGHRKSIKDILASYPQGVDVETVFRSYLPQIEQVHADFCSKYAAAAEPSLSEYRGYAKFLDQLGSRNTWRLLLEIAKKSGADPYKHLERHLNSEQLSEVIALPMRSKAQVDRIIEFIDRHGTCDDPLRKEVYALFNVNGMVEPSRGV
jgi:hypothetical protein